MDGPTREGKTSLLALLRRSGEDDLGAAMVRLAKLAAATEQVERELAGVDETDGGDAIEGGGEGGGDMRGLQGRSLSRVVRRDEAGSFRREVGR